MENDDYNLRYPIGKPGDSGEVSKVYSEALKRQLLNDIKMLPSMLEFAIKDLDAAQLHTPYRPSGWTIHQVIHHIADSHMNAYIRFKLGLTEDNPTIKTYEEAAWAELPDTKNLPINISLTLLHALHARWYELMNEMTMEQWQRTVYHPERKLTMTLWDLLKTYSWHSLHHTAHITKLRERMKWT
jgi:uncharacterized damage-inducible protein DinB